MSRPISFQEAVDHIKRFVASLDYVTNEYTNAACKVDNYTRQYEAERKERERFQELYNDAKKRAENLERRVKELEAENNKLKDAIISKVCEMPVEVKGDD